MRFIKNTQVTSKFEKIMPFISAILLTYSVGFIARYWFPSLFLLIIILTFGAILLPGIIPFYSLLLWNSRKLNFRQKLFHTVALFCTFIILGIIVNFEDEVNVDGYKSLVVSQAAKQIAVIAIISFFFIQLGRFIYICKDRTKP